jgi:type IV pilus assembly protein PilA
MKSILKMQLHRDRKGFTLVEVIVVLVILAILAAIAIPSLTGYIDRANQRAVISQARSIAVALQAAATDAFGQGQTVPGGPSDGGDNVYASGPTFAAEVNELAGENIIDPAGNLSQITFSGTKLTKFQVILDSKTVTYNGTSYTVQ